jgi:hypothetical protein
MTMPETATTEITDLTGTDIHTWFGLTYSNYLVLPRTLLQSMPRGWQERFVVMLEELQAAFAHIETAECYKVDAATEHELGELDDAQLRALGITRHDDCEHLAGDDCDCRATYSSAERNDMDRSERVLIPCADPVPHYRRGRTHVEPRLPAGWLDGHPVPRDMTDGENDHA